MPHIETPLPTSTVTCIRPVASCSLQEKASISFLLGCSDEFASAFLQDLYNLTYNAFQAQIFNASYWDAVQLCENVIERFACEGSKVYKTACTLDDFHSLTGMSYQIACNVVQELCLKCSMNVDQIGGIKLSLNHTPAYWNYRTLFANFKGAPTVVVSDPDTGAVYVENNPKTDANLVNSSITMPGINFGFSLGAMRIGNFDILLIGAPSYEGTEGPGAVFGFNAYSMQMLFNITTDYGCVGNWANIGWAIAVANNTAFLRTAH